LNNSETVSVKKVYGETLVKLGKVNPNVVVVEADLMKASGSGPFLEAYPERHFDVGVAEQNLVGVAAGLAAMGKIPFASTFANFASQRACDQAFMSVAYNQFNVKICGDYAGLTSEKNGAIHISVADIVIFRSMPNITVVVPGDCTELASAMEAITNYKGPVYLRKARGLVKSIFPPDYKFEIGKAVMIQEGYNVTLITTGITTYEGIKACDVINSESIGVRHIHLPTIKPIDREVILRAAYETGVIVTVENHSWYGGLGSAVTEIICEECPVPVIRLGIKDCFGQTADLEWLLDEYEISSKLYSKGS